MPFSPILTPLYILFTISLFVFVTIGALESPTVRTVPYILLISVVLLQFRLVAYYFFLVQFPALLDL